MNSNSPQKINPGNLKKEVEAGSTEWNGKQAAKRLFEKDASLWKTDEENVKSINNRLGWLDVPTNAKELVDFATQIKNENYKHAVLLGMGGSSLCSEVARQTFAPGDGYPALLVLDNTSPDAILHIQKQIDLSKTLFIAASKSGGTMETVSFFKYFYNQLEQTGFADPGKNFVAITDDGTPLVRMASDMKFRRVFINRGDIGGRYSVLSDFGLLPMALMGIDIEAMLASTTQMKNSCDPKVALADNPGASLGIALGIAQHNGRDKVTFIMSPSIHAFGYWVEQLIAESTGKEGKGLIPVTGEAIGAPDVYSNDRIFIHMYLSKDDNANDTKALAALEKAGHPIVSINVADELALGGEYYRWEVATAIAGAVIGINPFNEPNVAEGKKNTNDLLAEWAKDGAFKKPTLLLRENELMIYGSNAVKQIGDRGHIPVNVFIEEFISLVEPDNYISLLCYFEETDERTAELQKWRMQLRDEKKTATTFAYGPRYLHSTGQLHKGGPATGVYIIITGDNKEALPIPDQKFGFYILNEAQSLGDFRSLNDKGRKVLYIQVGKEIDKGLQSFLQLLSKKELGKTQS
jgi:transaldolase/glucose-6-phosphate isomerase